MTFDRLEVTDNGVSFRAGFKKKSIPFEDIDRAFIRIHEMDGKLCCGSTVFQYFRMVFVDKDGREFADYLSEDEKAMDAALEEIGKHVKTGFTKND